MHKYKPGDVVFYRSQVVSMTIAAQHLVAAELPMGMTVLETQVQTCPGGTQYHYCVAGRGVRQTLLDVEVVGEESDEFQELLDYVTTFREREILAFKERRKKGPESSPEQA